jgi:hypothetical protein
MTDKEFVGCKKRIKALLDEWAFGIKSRGPRLVVLRDWVITVRYNREPFNTPDGEEAGAQVVSSWFYKTAEIDFNCSNLYQTGPLEMELVVIHELCHLLVNEAREWGGKYGERTDEWSHHEERVVTDLSVAFLQTKHWDRGKGDKGRESGKVGE